MMKQARKWFSVPDERTKILAQAQVIRQKPFLKRVYCNFYQEFQKVTARLPQGLLVEIGSGGGFLKEVMPTVITSDILPLPGCDLVFAAEKMPFADNSVAAFFLLNVFHHLHNPEKALREMVRCLKKKGRVVMIEPANTFFSYLVYRFFHHEPFEPKADWKVKGGPVSGANGALPWIVFCRDRRRFEEKFPELKIRRIAYHTPLAYLLSGGCSYPQLVPFCFYQPIKWLERLLSPLDRFLAMFWTIELEKVII